MHTHCRDLCRIRNNIIRGLRRCTGQNSNDTCTVKISVESEQHHARVKEMYWSEQSTTLCNTLIITSVHAATCTFGKHGKTVLPALCSLSNGRHNAHVHTKKHQIHTDYMQTNRNDNASSGINYQHWHQLPTMELRENQLQLQ